MSNGLRLACAWLAVAAAPAANAEVTDRGATGFTVHHALVVAAQPDRVYAAFTDIGKWWDPAHSYSNDGARLTLDTSNGGCFCETLPDGGHVRHLDVVFVKPDEELRLTGGLGPLQPIGAGGTMVVQFKQAENGTTIDLTYAVNGYLPDGMESWAEPVDGVLAQQLQRLRRFIATGSPALAE
jgi:uncharacterized protein YndB with AHSA1/START domain